MFIENTIADKNGVDPVSFTLELPSSMLVLQSANKG